jgi:hypothetical protein
MQAELRLPEEGLKYLGLEIADGVSEEVVSIRAAATMIAGGQHEGADDLLVLRVGLGHLSAQGQRPVLLVDLVAVDGNGDLAAADHASALRDEPVKATDAEHERPVSRRQDLVILA